MSVRWGTKDRRAEDRFHAHRSHSDRDFKTLAFVLWLLLTLLIVVLPRPAGLA
jgi:hypothetical protein